MRQRDISKHRILQAFARPRRSSLTSRMICEITGLKRRTVSPCLGELVSDNLLKYSLAKDRKTKIYNPRNPEDCRKPLTIDGPRKRKQFERLEKLGLHAWWVRNARGRPKRLGSYPGENENVLKIVENTRTLPEPAWRYLAKKTGVKYELENGKLLPVITTKDGQLKQVAKTLPEAREHFKTLQRLRKSGRGNPAERYR